MTFATAWMKPKNHVGREAGQAQAEPSQMSEMLNPKEDNMVQGLGMEGGVREHGECIQG